MARVLRENPRPNGLTLVTADLDGVRVVTVSILTAILRDVSDEELDAIIRQSTAITRERIPR